MNIFMLSSSLFMYLCSISHSICSLMSFLLGRNMFFRISTNSICKEKGGQPTKKVAQWCHTCNWALEIFFLTLRIFMIASWVLKILNWRMPWFSSSLVFSVDSCSLPIRLILPLLWIFPFFTIAKSWKCPLKTIPGSLSWPDLSRTPCSLSTQWVSSWVARPRGPVSSV